MKTEKERLLDIHFNIKNSLSRLESTEVNNEVQKVKRFLEESNETKELNDIYLNKINLLVELIDKNQSRYKSKEDIPTHVKKALDDLQSFKDNIIIK